MRKNLMMAALLLAVASCTAAYGQAVHVIPGDGADVQMFDDGSMLWVGQNSHRVGLVSGKNSISLYVFQLPALAPGDTVTAAHLDFDCVNGSYYQPTGNLNLYGLGYRAATNFTVDDFFQGDYGSDTTDATPIQQDFGISWTGGQQAAAIGTNATDIAGDQALAAYLNAQYAAGASGGDYVILRLNLETPQTSANYVTVSSGDHATVPPVLTFGTNGASLSRPPVADAGDDQTVKDDDGGGFESVTLDGSRSADADDNIVSWVWTETGITLGSGETATIDLTVGVHTITLTVTDADGLTDTDTVDVTVESAPFEPMEAAYIFYNNSVFDGDDPTANSGDDDAIDTTKSPMQPTAATGIANYTSYDKGINGVILDLHSLSDVISAADFEFKVGNNPEPDDWTTAPAPTSVTMRIGQGVNDSDRVTIIWPDGAIKNQWLQITVKANRNTGVPADEMIYFGNAVGETGNSVADAIVDATDEIACRNNPHTFIKPAAADNLYDHNKDGKVDATDQILSRNNTTTFATRLALIDYPLPNVSPVADAGGSRSVADFDRSGDEMVTLNASASYDSDGTIVSYAWSQAGTDFATGITTDILLTSGDHYITLTVTDDEGSVHSDTVVITVVASTTYYVDDVNGDDTNDGSQAFPWKTIQHAAGQVNATDIVIVLPGVYDEKVTISQSGLNGALLTFRAEPSRQAKVKGFVLAADYVKVQGFEITNSAPGAIGINAGEAHRGTARIGCQMIDNYIHDVDGRCIMTGENAIARGNLMRNIGDGFLVNSGSLVEDNEIDGLMIVMDAPDDPRNAKYAFWAGHNITFRGNYWHGTPMDHMENMSCDFFASWDTWIWGDSSNILIENNICFNATHASEPYGAGNKNSHTITYRNNLFANTVYVGIFCNWWHNVTIINNTFINCGAYPIWFQRQEDTVGSTVRNNLISYYNHNPLPAHKPAESGIRIDSWDTIDFCDYNMIFNCVNRQYGPNDFTAEPIFVDPDNGDFRLASGSPGIDAGSSLMAPPTDMDGVTRPQGAAFDVGAWELPNDE